MKKISITKKFSISLVGLIAMLMLLAAPVYAEKTSDMNQGGQKAKGLERGGMTSAAEIARQDAILASTLMDKDVHDAQGDKIGEVSDVLIGPDGNVEYIVLSQKDGFLGLGEKDLVPVPWNKVSDANIDKDQDAVTLSLSKQELENAPSFNEEEWQAFLGGEKQQEVRGYYGTEDASRSGQAQMLREKTTQAPGVKTDASKETESADKSVMASSRAPAAKADASTETKSTDRGAMTSAQAPGVKTDASKEMESTDKSVMASSQAPAAKADASTETKSTDRGAMTSTGQMTRNDAILASTLMDKDVHDAQDEKIGEVSDIMIGQDGKVEYIVLSQKDGFLGLGEKDLVPVPWNKVSNANIDKDQDAVTLSLSKQELENAPSFNEEEWQAFLGGEKQQEVRGYYGTEDARPSGQEQMMRDKTGQNPGMNTGESYEKKKEETERKGGERKY